MISIKINIFSLFLRRIVIQGTWRKVEAAHGIDGSVSKEHVYTMLETT